MARSPSSSVQAARDAVAARLRELCQDAGLKRADIAARTGWYPSKVSRIATGTTPPSDADIQAWCAACGADDQADDLIAASRAADTMYVEWRRVQRAGLRRVQESRVPLYQRTRFFRVYCSNVVPGLFQTEAYATALLRTIARFHRTPDDVAEAVAARVARSDGVVREGDHRFAVLVEESVLRNRVGDSETMAGQLGYLLALMSLPRVSLGIVPFTARREMWTLEAFNVFDDQRVHVELLTAAVTVTAPTEVEQYVRAFAELASQAVHGAAARALIAEAINALE
ncbi:helix-turn-helix domain-containing protein [Kitasatospora sp. NPDC088783]|uniref:helix-turn-helix domain-containing protein n=1 Tax=Kitasatospora sp. NPDC088783 TaxID=3364077 RepID=UPI0038178AF5